MNITTLPAAAAPEPIRRRNVSHRRRTERAAIREALAGLAPDTVLRIELDGTHPETVRARINVAADRLGLRVHQARRGTVIWVTRA